jgi:hypothetical protein
MEKEPTGNSVESQGSTDIRDRILPFKRTNSSQENETFTQNLNKINSLTFKLIKLPGFWGFGVLGF